MSDYSEFKKTEIGDNLLAQINAGAFKQKELELEVEKLKESLKLKEKELAQISQITMPELMDAAGMKSFVTKDGITIGIKETVRGYISEANVEPAMKYLDDNGHGNLAKRQFVIPFGREEREWAEEFKKQLEDNENIPQFKIKADVHWATLSSWVKEQLEQGVNLPLDLFSVEITRSTKIV